MSKAMRRPKWLMLVYQLPTKPSRVRVRVWRQLQKLGAVAVKNSVYVLPNTEAAEEDFQWVSQEIMAAGGKAALFAADALGSLGDEEVEALFLEARAKDYEALIAECDKVRSGIEEDAKNDHLFPNRADAYEATGKQLQVRFDQICAIDFFKAPNMPEALEVVRNLRRAVAEHRGLSRALGEATEPPVSVKELQGKVWVTRRGLHVDRLASAWLIVRFVDAKARFRLVTPRGRYREKKGEVCFDMYGGEFSHHGDDCTFETMLKRLGLTDNPALVHVGQIVHDIDLKDGKFRREQARGIDAVVLGLTKTCRDDESLRKAGNELFDALYAHFQQPAAKERPRPPRSKGARP